MSRAAGALWLCTGAAILFPGTLAAEPTAVIVPATPSPTAAATALTADIPPQLLAQALEDLARQTGLQYVSVDGVVSNQQTRGAPAGLPAAEALRRLLEGTGLRFEALNERIVRIVAINPGARADQPNAGSRIGLCGSLRTRPRETPEFGGAC